MPAVNSMPSPRMPWRRLLVGATLALAVVSSAIAATPSVGVALDTDDNAGDRMHDGDGGSARSRASNWSSPARIVTTAVGAHVDRIERQACAGGTIGGPVGSTKGTGRSGWGAGTGGSSVVELWIPRSMLPRDGRREGRGRSRATGASGSDATWRVRIASPHRRAARRCRCRPPWLVVPLALAVALSAAWLARRYPRHGSLAGLLVAFVFTGLAWAAGSFVRDGAIGDWAGIAPAVGDASGDGGANADIVAAFRAAGRRRTCTCASTPTSARTGPERRAERERGCAGVTLPAARRSSARARPGPGALPRWRASGRGRGFVRVAGRPARRSAPPVLRRGFRGALRRSPDDDPVQSGGGGNVAPTVNAGAPQAIALPAAATLAGSATDDGLPAPPAALSVAWTLDSGPPGGIASFTNPASPTSQVSFNAPGSYVLRLTANDGALSASATTTVTVSDGPPALAAIADRTIELGTRLQIVLEAKDGNAGDALVYSLPIAPAGAALRPAPLVDWVPTDAQLGTHPFTARVTDGSGASAARSFNVTVVRTNHAPTIAPQANEVVRGGVTFVRRVVATDPDEGDTLTFDLLAGPPGMAVTGSELAWPTGGVSPGDKAVTVRVRDAAGLADQASFTLTLLPSAASVAIDDEYEVRVGETLVVPAAGVLANDANPSGAPMSAVKKTDPALGSLSAFGADGAFSFVAPGAVVPPPFGIAEAWRNSLSGQTSYAFPVVGDVNDDGYPDMLLNHQGGTRAVDGRTGATLWNMSGAGYPDCYIIATTNAPVLADVDDDGKLEYVGALAGCERDSSAGTPGYAPQDRIMALDATTGLIKWLSPRISASLGDVLAPGTPPSTEDRYQHVYPAAQYAGMHVARLAPGAAPTLLFRQTIRRDLGYYTPMSGPARGAGCRAITGRAEDDGEACRVTVLMRGDGAVETMLVAPNPSNINQGSWDPWRELAPFTVDVDADGTPEIVSGSDVAKRRGTWQLLWQSEYEPIQSLAADLDGDGKPRSCTCTCSTRPARARGRARLSAATSTASAAC
ncbi:MAG: hypothetical protein IPG84_19875 [Betaproteobacteria bacterium]|nr:hypothetical protein [Betaproteobacteria bacterium]